MEEQLEREREREKENAEKKLEKSKSVCTAICKWFILSHNTPVEAEKRAKRLSLSQGVSKAEHTFVCLDFERETTTHSIRE